MTVIEHNKILAIGTFLLLTVVSLGVFAALGITSANDPGNGPSAGIGIIGGVVAVIFYTLLGGIFVLPMALASRKMLKRGRNARTWGIIAAILVAPIMPLGTMFGIYGLWFFFSAEGRRFNLSVESDAVHALRNN